MSTGTKSKATVILALALTLLSAQSLADASAGIAAMKSGDYQTAYDEFYALAEEGDSRAMVTIGMLFYEGQGFAQDYGVAMDWFIKALELGNGDAVNNIGVMYRDGLGVPVNRTIAYDLFLIVHMRGMGGASTQARANRNLRREVAELTEEQVMEALCLSEEYVITYAIGRGNTDALDSVNSTKQVAIKDRDWWLEGELPSFECP